MEKKITFLVFRSTPATESFVSRKMGEARLLGVSASVKRSDAATTEEALAVIGETVAENPNGIVVQLPLPKDFDTEALLDAVPVEMDVDVLSKESKELFMQKKTERMPPVVYAIKKTLDANSIGLAGKKIVVLGAGRLVGKPVAAWLEREGFSSEMVTKDTLEQERLALIAQADILISGMGSPHFIKPEMVKEGVVLIDAGTSEQAGKLAGDIDPSCAAKAALLTPVPGGIGPLTVEGLFKNLFLQ